MPKILVADDMWSVRSSLQAVLEIAGYSDFIEAENVKGTYDCLVQQNPDIAFIDTQMPNAEGYPIDGIDICKKYRALPGGDKTVIIGMSSSSSYEARWLASGADLFFHKAKSGVNIADVVNQAINNHT